MPNIQHQAVEALKACDEYVQTCLGEYLHRNKLRKKAGNIPTISMVGRGRGGKDEFAKYLGTISPLQYGGSLSLIAAPLVAHAMKAPMEETWITRHNHSPFWKDFLNAIRTEDQTLLARMLLGRGDMITGTRSFYEYRGCLAEGVIQHVVWISRRGVPRDEVLEYSFDDVIEITPHDQLTWVRNDSSLEDLHRKAHDLVVELEL